jgi:flagellar hook-length control protein FliK
MPPIVLAPGLAVAPAASASALDGAASAAGAVSSQGSAGAQSEPFGTLLNEHINHLNKSKQHTEKEIKHFRNQDLTVVSVASGVAVMALPIPTPAEPPGRGAPADGESPDAQPGLPGQAGCAVQAPAAACGAGGNDLPPADPYALPVPLPVQAAGLPEPPVAADGTATGAAHALALPPAATAQGPTPPVEPEFAFAPRPPGAAADDTGAHAGGSPASRSAATVPARGDAPLPSPAATVGAADPSSEGALERNPVVRGREAVAVATAAAPSHGRDAAAQAAPERSPDAAQQPAHAAPARSVGAARGAERAATPVPFSVPSPRGDLEAQASRGHAPIGSERGARGAGDADTAAVGSSANAPRATPAAMSAPQSGAPIVSVRDASLPRRAGDAAMAVRPQASISPAAAVHPQASISAAAAGPGADRERRAAAGVAGGRGAVAPSVEVASARPWQGLAGASVATAAASAGSGSDAAIATAADGAGRADASRRGAGFAGVARRDPPAGTSAAHAAAPNTPRERGSAAQAAGADVRAADARAASPGIAAAALQHSPGASGERQAHAHGSESPSSGTLAGNSAERQPRTRSAGRGESANAATRATAARTGAAGPPDGAPRWVDPPPLLPEFPASPAAAEPARLARRAAVATSVAPAQVAQGTAVAQDAALLQASRGERGLDPAGAAGAVRQRSPAESGGTPSAPTSTATAAHTTPLQRADSAPVPAPAPTPFALAAGTRLGEELGHRILWLSGNRLRGAEIQLDPPELGPLQVQIHAHRDGTSVHFLAHSAAAREAVESSLPRLREMLEGSGLNLLDVNVAQQQEQRGRSPWDGQGAPAGGPAGARLREVEHAVVSTRAREQVPRGLVDDYA